jgi:cytochrome c556
MHFQFGSSLAVAAAAALMLVTLAGPSPAQDKPAAQPTAKDTIFARKILMGGIDYNMDQIEEMLEPEAKLELADAQEHAETISTMLMAFPHMFPPATNQWTQGAVRDPAYDTFAAPEVWTNFADFYARATEASKIAWAASRAKRAVEFKPLIAQLRQHCNACHAINMKSE